MNMARLIGRNMQLEPTAVLAPPYPSVSVIRIAVS